MAAATLLDLQTIITDGGTRNRVVAALCRTAVSISYEAAETANHTARVTFAHTILTSDANTIAGQVVKYVVAACAANNAGFDAAAITGMSDASLQSYVDAAVSLLAGG